MKNKKWGGLKKHVQDSQIILWRKRGLSFTRIAKKVGCSGTHVGDIINGNTKRYEDKSEWAKFHREYRRKNIKKIRAYKREYNRKWRAKYGYHNEANSKSRYPEKEKARVKTRYAVKSGKLKKLPCKECGNKNSFAHHHDYTKPLEITWLCRRHHAIADGRSMDLSPITVDPTKIILI